jgi:hypothetical protein
MKKIALFAFNGESMCFVHVLLNALDMKGRGYDVRVVIEGAATKLVPELASPGSPLSQLYQKAKEQGLLEGVCKACSAKMGTLEAAKGQGLSLLDDMSGHPGIARYLEAGYDVLVF